MSIKEKTPLYRSLCASYDRDIYLPLSNVISAPVIHMQACEELLEILSGECPPQSVILPLNSSLDVTDTKGNVICDLYSALSHSKKSVPILILSNKETADSLSLFADENNLADASVCVPFENASLLKYVYNILPFFRPMIDMRGVSLPCSYSELPGKIASLGGTGVILDGENLTQDDVRRMRRRFLQVIICEKESAAESVVLGSNGIIAKNPAKYYSLYEKLPENTLLKHINLYAHKGFTDNGRYSENTITAVTAAGDNGFDGAEIDIKLTSDSVPVVMHNINTKGMFIGEEYETEKATFKELSTLRRVGFENEGVDSFFALAERMSKYTETPLVIELKSEQKNYNTEELMLKVDEILSLPSTQENATVIMGGSNLPGLSYVRKKLPYLPAAYTDYEKKPILPEERKTAEELIYKISNRISGCSCAYNPEDTMINRLLNEYLKFRGITAFPWSRSWFFAPSKWEEQGRKCDAVFLSGVDGWTTDHGEMYFDIPIELRLKDFPKQIKRGETINAFGINLFRSGEKKNAENTKVIILNLETEKNNSSVATSVGNAECVLVQKINLHFGDSVHIVSEPFSVEVI